MPDRYQGQVAGLDSPAVHAFAVTPDDGADLSEISRAIYVGTGGDIAVTLRSGSAVTFANVGAGTVLPVRVQRVLATGTTAADIVALV